LVPGGKGLPAPKLRTMNASAVPKARSVVNEVVGAGALPKAGCGWSRSCWLTKTAKSVGAELVLFGAELDEPELPEDVPPPDVVETGGPLSEPPQAANAASPTAAITVKSGFFMVSLRGTQ
jgi:hypothetical protein